MFLYIEETSGD